MAQTKESKAASNKKYRQSKKQELSDKQKIYYIKNRDRILERDKKYREANKEKILKKEKIYRETNKDKIKVGRVKRKDKRREYYKTYQKNRRESEPAFKFIRDLRTRQGKVLKGVTSTTKGLGCNREFLLGHLSSQFTEGMTLENHGWGEGKWHIDHIFPLSSYEEDENGNWKVDSEYNKLLIHFTNLQPLWHEDNLEKSDKVI